jgi:Tfp pilus assembly protein PilO
MDKPIPKPVKKSNPVESLVLVLGGVVVLTLALLYFLSTQVKTVKLLREQKTQLEQDLKIINSAEQIYESYKDDIAVISEVFPNEESVLVFLQTLESLSKKYSTESLVKFSPPTPQAEGDSLYLLFSIVMQTTSDQLPEFLKAIEQLPYMTRLLTLNVSLPEGGKGNIAASMRIKVYVKNPFSTN